MKNFKSITACLWVVRILIFVAFVSIFFIPQIADYYSIVANNGGDISFPITISLYVLLIPAIVTMITLHILLNNIKKENTFIKENVFCLTIICLCLFVVGVVCAIVSLISYFFAFICVSFLFMGLILIVLRNVFSSAVKIKEENDLTI